MDWAALATALTTELGEVLTACVGIVTLIMSVRVGLRFFRTMSKG